MIIKFDHISYVESRENKKNYLQYLKDKGYQYKFKEENMVNFSSKKKLMQLDQETHDIYYFEPKMEMPVEFIFYPYAGKSSKVEKKGNIIYVSGRKGVIIMESLRKIGFRFLQWDSINNIIRCNIKGILDRQDYWLIINLKKERHKVFLDDKGYGCITFLVNSFKNLYTCAELGDYLSEPAEVCINKQRLDIIFYKNSNIDIFFEFCKPIKYASIKSPETYNDSEK